MEDAGGEWVVVESDVGMGASEAEAVATSTVAVGLGADGGGGGSRSGGVQAHAHAPPCSEVPGSVMAVQVDALVFLVHLLSEPSAVEAWSHQVPKPLCYGLLAN